MTSIDLITPKPTTNPETLEFWNAAANGELRLQRCLDCRSVIWYPRRFCPVCHRTNTESFAASGQGVVYSYTVNYRGEGAYREADPYVLAYVELAEGPRILTNIVDTATSELKVEAPVTVVFHPVDGETALPRFRILQDSDVSLLASDHYQWRKSMNKVVGSISSAIADMSDGCTIGVGGFGVVSHGFPTELITEVANSGLKDLTIVCNSLGTDDMHPAAIVRRGRASRVIAAFSARAGAGIAVSAKGMSPVDLEIELVPQGILVERLRMGGVSLGPFYSPVGVDTILAENREITSFDGKPYLLEYPLHLDYALIYASVADTAGNLSFRGTSANFGPSFAKGARTVIVQADQVVDVGDLPAEDVDLPGVFVDRVVKSAVPRSAGWRTPRKVNNAIEYNGKPGLTPSQLGARIAELLPEPGYVNLGTGLPTMVCDHVADRDITLHSENGVLGYSTRVTGQDADLDIYNASSEPVTLKKGASFFDSIGAFEIARSGRLSAVVLGAFEVDESGSFANWTTPEMGGGAIGGAMDLLVNPGQVIIAMRHVDSSGRPKVVKQCRYPVTGKKCVNFVVTDIAVIESDAQGLVLRGVAPGFTPDEVCALTDATLRVELWPASETPVMQAHA